MRNKWLQKNAVYVIFAIGGLAMVVIVLLLANEDVISNHAMTMSAITETSVRIGMFVDRNKQLPQKLDVLPERAGYANRITDAWKHSLIYVVNSEDTFTLTSLGRDGVVGGEGDNADIIFKYKVTNGNVQQVP
jgi:Type II secretion system (T2SS), protein G